jgi:hypothetical protein
MSTKIRVTLPELHEWILDAREVLYDGIHEDMAAALDIEVVGEPDDKPEDVTKVQEAFRKVLEAVDNLDCLFHDKFDCR